MLAQIQSHSYQYRPTPMQLVLWLNIRLFWSMQNFRKKQKYSLCIVRIKSNNVYTSQIYRSVSVIRWFKVSLCFIIMLSVWFTPHDIKWQINRLLAPEMGLSCILVQFCWFYTSYFNIYFWTRVVLFRNAALDSLRNRPFLKHQVPDICLFASILKIFFFFCV